MESSLEYKIISYDPTIDKSAFDCGIEPLNIYLKKYSGINDKKGIGKTFFLIDSKKRLSGYYTVSMAEILFESLPDSVRKGIPRYPLPAMRIGRLAVDISQKGLGLGGRLLIDSLKRAIQLSLDIGIYVVLVDAKNEDAVAFYKHFGFKQLKDSNQTLYLPIETIIRANN